MMRAVGVVGGGGGEGLDGGEVVGGGAGGENGDAAGGHVGEDFGDLFGGLAGGVDDLRQASAEAAMVVDLGVAEVFKREGGELGRGLVRGDGAALDLGEKFEEGVGGHGVAVRG